jgi:hypothetical protein|tara:strand:- start:472 stop:612 length:141 start_codon:yes stop_codon:yes gene_type:complete
MDFNKLIGVPIKKATVKVAYILERYKKLLFTQPFVSEIGIDYGFNE